MFDNKFSKDGVKKLQEFARKRPNLDIKVCLWYTNNREYYAVCCPQNVLLLKRQLNSGQHFYVYNIWYSESLTEP